MAVCDICNAPGMGTVISAEDVRKAVFQKGFNPFQLGLGGGPGAAMLKMMGISDDAAYQDWKGRVAQDTSDWNICPKCMGVLKRYLVGTPHAAGVASSSVTANPILNILAAQAAEQRYGQGHGGPVRPLSQPVSSRNSSETDTWYGLLGIVFIVAMIVTWWYPLGHLSVWPKIGLTVGAVVLCGVLGLQIDKRK